MQKEAKRGKTGDRSLQRKREFWEEGPGYWECTLADCRRWGRERRSAEKGEVGVDAEGGPVEDKVGRWVAMAVVQFGFRGDDDVLVGEAEEGDAASTFQFNLLQAFNLHAVFVSFSMSGIEQGPWG